MRRGVIDPEVEAILRPLRTAMARALLEDGRADHAVVEIAGREGFSLPEPIPAQSGVSWAVLRRADALGIGRAHTLECGELLAERLDGPEAWVLVLGAEGAAVVTLRWDPPAPSASTAS